MAGMSNALPIPYREAILAIVQLSWTVEADHSARKRGKSAVLIPLGLMLFDCTSNSSVTVPNSNA